MGTQGSKVIYKLLFHVRVSHIFKRYKRLFDRLRGSPFEHIVWTSSFIICTWKREKERYTIKDRIKEILRKEGQKTSVTLLSRFYWHTKTEFNCFLDESIMASGWLYKTTIYIGRILLPSLKTDLSWLSLADKGLKVLKINGRVSFICYAKPW